MGKKYLIVFWLGSLILLSNYAKAQVGEISLKGTVISTETGEALPGVSIAVRGTLLGSTTDVNGKYSLSVPLNATLVFSYVGYLAREYSIQDQTILDVSLDSDSKSLEEVVVVGYTKQSRTKITAAVSRLDQAEMKNIPSVSPVQALQGKIAGVSVPVSSGQPGQNPDIIIRGGTSLGSGGSALIIVDGVFRNFNDVNPDDIASVQVLKDAASTAIYGARGSNGVVLITTKSGSANQKPTISFRYQHGIERQARQYDYLNGRDYLILARQTWAKGKDVFDVNQKLYQSGNSATVPTYKTPGQFQNSVFTPAYVDNLVSVEGQQYVDKLLSNGWETVEDPVNPGKTIIFKDNHYQDLIWNAAATRNYNFSIDGGSEKANYFVSLGYVNQGGVFLGTNYKRFSGLANVGFKVTERFRLDANISYLWNDNKNLGNEVNSLIRSTRIPPLNRIFDDSGNAVMGEDLTVRNRLHELDHLKINANTEQVVMRLAGDYKILSGLFYRPSLSFYMDDYNRSLFETYFPQQSSPRSKSQEMNTSRQIMTDHILQYDKVFGRDHNITLLGGFNFTRNTGTNFRGTGQRSSTDYISTFTGDPSSSIINGVVSPNFGLSSSFSESRTASFFGQFSYDYDGRYLLAGSLRYDGFSYFAPNNRYATFPSLSIGWNLHKEKFWNLKIINQLKVRASTGSTGLSQLSYTDTYGGYSSVTYATSGGVTRTSLANPNLVWETTKTYDAGMDVSFFNGRLNLILDYYRKITVNRLNDLPLPAESGFSSIRYNVGKLRNRGFEAELHAVPVRSKNFTWQTNFSFGFNRTVVLELPENSRGKNRIGGGLIYDIASGKEIEVGGYAEGERPLGLWAFKSNGIFATDEEAKASTAEDRMLPAVTTGKKKNAGDVNWADLNNDGIIDSRDVVFIGYRKPDKIGGMQNSFSYKGITIRFTVDYALGHVISNSALARSMGQARASNEGAPAFALSEQVWQNDGDRGKVYPRFSFGDTNFGYKNHLRQVANGVGIGDTYGTDVDFYYSKGNFLAFRELSVSYNVPQNITKTLKVRGIELNTGIYNIGYLTKYTGLNPEVYNGFDPGGYPRPRQIVFGANIKL